MISKKIKIVFSIPFVIILLYTGYLLNIYDSIPQIIPIHGYGKNTDGFGSKIFLFFPIVLNLILLMFIWWIIKSPDKINLSFEVKEEDKASTYATVQMVLAVLSIFITIILTILLFYGVVFK
ncbi:SdpI family protein [Chryseobacterium paridis]|uniref:DUF1648 domain-containing protein n=1 Tax=Chryseobacterium paridis TaxID=2800328 RepID=A0ABS1FRL5_9FLAO|nr:hypothetical protein [Chryseobacterium paridis]MBK1895073.1 hypothetical protein [Chryseobacterium paridis]